MNVIIGYARMQDVDKNNFPILYNSAAIFHYGKNGDYTSVYDKQLLANKDYHEDLKYFQAGKLNRVYSIWTERTGNINIGIAICEDAWKNDHSRDVVSELCSKGAELIVSINQSYFYYGKQKIRYDLFSEHAKSNKVPVVTVNSVGVGDIVKNIIIFDGGSMAFNENGEMIAECKRFKEDFKTFYLNYKPKKFKEQKKYDELFNALVFEQGELFEVIKIPRAQVHLSGGIDSALVATIVQEAMGKDHTFFITNPSKNNEEKLFKLVRKLCENLHTDCNIQSIQRAYEATAAKIRSLQMLISNDRKK
jgi:NAD+ synthase (glutamine-hydrolysing)